MKQIMIERFKGMADAIEPTKLPNNAFSSLINIRPLVTKLEKIDGYKKLSKTQTGQGILAINQLIHSSGSRDIYVQTSDRIKKYNTTTLALDDFTVMADEGLNPLSAENAGVVYQDKLFIADKNNEPYFIAGQTTDGIIKEKVVAKIKLVSNNKILLVDPNTDIIIGTEIEGKNRFTIENTVDAGALSFCCQIGDLVYIKKSKSILVFDKNQNKILTAKIFPETLYFIPQENFLYGVGANKIYKINYINLTYININIPGYGGNLFYRGIAWGKGVILLSPTSFALYGGILARIGTSVPINTSNTVCTAAVFFTSDDSFKELTNNVSGTYTLPEKATAQLQFIGSGIVSGGAFYLNPPWTWNPSNYKLYYYTTDNKVLILFAGWREYRVSYGINKYFSAGDFFEIQLDKTIISRWQIRSNELYTNLVYGNRGFHEETITSNEIAYTNYEIDISFNLSAKLFKVGTPPKVFPYKFKAGTVTAGKYKFSQEYHTVKGLSSESPLSAEITLSGSTNFKLYFGLPPVTYPYGILERLIYVYKYNVTTGLWVKGILDQIVGADEFEKEYNDIILQNLINIDSYSLLPKCTIVAEHLERLLWAGDVESPNCIYFSEVLYPEFYTTAGFRMMKHNDGDIIKVIKSVYDRAYIFKERYIYVVIDDIVDGQVLKVEEGRGCIAPKTAIIIGTSIFFLSDVGVCALIQDKVKNLSEDYLDLSGYTKAELRAAFADYDEENGDYRVYIKDDVIVYNISNQAFYYQQKVNFDYSCSGMVIMDNIKKILFATDENYVFLENEGLFFDTEKRYCRLTTKKYNAGDNKTELLLSNLKMNAELNSDLIVYNTKAVKKIKPLYENYYDLRLKNFFGKDIQLDMFEASLYDLSINDFALEVA